MKKNDGIKAPDILFCVAREAVPSHGEDSWYYATDYEKTIIGVFDGSGGIGAQQYSCYKNNTGAYMASRAVAGGVQSWFESSGEVSLDTAVNEALATCVRHAGTESGIKLKGSLRKDFPTTMALLSIKDNSGMLYADCYWAGDSRCYILDSAGLHQLSIDDVGSKDAMANLSDDGAMKNVINASVPFSIHMKQYEFSEPCLLVSATDGCFGYLPSPMHFEHMILHTLISSDSIQQWKAKIDKALHKCAGDDYTICITGYGFTTFSEVKNFCSNRHAELCEKYIGNDQNLQELWLEYKPVYESYL